MAEHDSIAERGRALEDEYFRRKDRELIDRMKRSTADEAARRELGAATGVTDAAVIEELQALGFTPATVALLPFVPVVQVAWAEGGVSAAERHVVIKLARARGIEEGSPADRQLADWLAAPPDAQVFARATRLIRAVLDADSHDPGTLTADELVKYCEQIASASGGVFGIGWVSSDERALLKQIAADLTQRGKAS